MNKSNQSKFSFPKIPYSSLPQGVVNANFPQAQGTNPGKLRAFDEASAVAHLRKNQLANEENFMEKIKDWETSTQQK